MSAAPPPSGPPSRAERAPVAGHRPVARRDLLVGSALVVAAGAVGAGLGHRGGTAPVADPRVPPSRTLRELRAAVAAEQDMVDRTASARRHARGQRRESITRIHDDHVAHLAALRAVLAATTAAAGIATPTPQATGARTSHAAPVAPSVRQLRADEHRACTEAAARAARLDGDAAVLLACIAAGEASHAELLR